MPRRVNLKPTKLIPQIALQEVIDLRNKEEADAKDLKALREKLKESEKSILDRLKMNYKIEDAETGWKARVEKKKKKKTVSWKSEFVIYVGRLALKKLRRVDDIYEKIVKFTGSHKEADKMVKKHGGMPEAAFVTAAGTAAANKVTDGVAVEHENVLVID